MPRTVGEIITRSMRVATILGASEAMDSNDAADALIALNQMLDAWRAERLFAFAITELTQPLVAGTTTYAIGPAALINTSSRPVRMEYSFTRDAQNYDRPMLTIDHNEYASIALKTLQAAYPAYVHLEPAWPIGQVKIWPAASSVTLPLTMYLGVWTVLTEFADLNVSVSLPPGYELAIVYSLAEYLCIEYEKPISAAFAKKAQMARANIQQNNLTEPRIACEFTGVDNNSMTPYWRIAAGDF